MFFNTVNAMYAVWSEYNDHREYSVASVCNTFSLYRVCGRHTVYSVCGVYNVYSVYNGTYHAYKLVWVVFWVHPRAWNLLSFQKSISRPV